MLARRKHFAPTAAPTRGGLLRSSVRSFRSRRKRLLCNAKAAPGDVPRRTRAIPQALRAQIVHRRGECLNVARTLTRPTDQATVDFDIRGLPGYPEFVAAARVGDVDGRGLVAASTRAVITENATRRYTKPAGAAFGLARDPQSAALVRLAQALPPSPEAAAARDAAMARIGRSTRVPRVVTWCGVQFCPLRASKRRRFCSRSCASRQTRAVVARASVQGSAN